MLIEFSVANFRCFKDRVTLSLEASSDDHLEDTHVARSGEYRLLKSAAIYGANASGKSNLLRAMATFRDFIQASSKESQAGEPIPVAPFRLNTTTESQPSHFEIVFLANGTRYRYGFEATPQAVHAEWLFSKKDSIRETTLFTREGSKIEIGADYKEGRGLEERTRPNALFLSVAAQFNGPVAGEIFSWLKRFRNISGIEDSGYMRFTALELNKEPTGSRIRELVKEADVGIQDLRMVIVPDTTGKLPSNLREYRPGQPPNSAALNWTIHAFHKKFDEDGRHVGLVEFDLPAEESSGTQKFVFMSGPFIHTLDEGSILFVDELEARFHPLLTRALVGLFAGGANRKNAQLIYATHDEGLLDSASIRRDQVWFVEKDEFGASRLFSLAEFKVRKEAKFAKEYLLGQFGGIPHIRDLEDALSAPK